ncbi:hypothetical protein HPB49_023477 [Dermacentor silvarum]|uniref:Uncharacterized protein n=1 Tax=Dermacentor silvarum TaxID=543639 RepID=A0ACB8E3R2_DERSI|nr:hypothetical protein HPB49_023477 [Dermacentor silvarum]
MASPTIAFLARVLKMAVRAKLLLQPNESKMAPDDMAESRDLGTPTNMRSARIFQAQSRCHCTLLPVWINVAHSVRSRLSGYYCNNSAIVTFHVTDEGTSLLGLDAIQAQGIDIHGSSLSCQQVTGTPVAPEVKFASLPQNAPAEFAHLFSVSAKLRPLTLVLREQVSAELHRLESADIIERVSASEWISALVKKDNAIRLCIDLREPNKAIVVNAFPLTTTKELLHRLADATVFMSVARGRSGSRHKSKDLRGSSRSQSGDPGAAPEDPTRTSTRPRPGSTSGGGPTDHMATWRRARMGEPEPPGPSDFNHNERQR